MKALKELLVGTTHRWNGKGTLTAPITGIQSDSRRVGKNEAFVAIRGGLIDGHLYIEEASKRGASAIFL